jgi:PRC-barrel domain
LAGVAGGQRNRDILGRCLISTQPNADGCELDEGQITSRQLVIPERDTPELLDLVEEPFDQIARAVQMRAEAEVFAIGNATTQADAATASRGGLCGPCRLALLSARGKYSLLSTDCPKQFVVPPVARPSNRGGPTMVTESRETGSLISSDKVERTALYGANDTKIGSIERVMIDKMTDKVSYAVLSFGGFLGIGDDHYPLPWQSLKYDTNLGGYRTGITETQLKGAPKYGNDNTWNWVDPT